MKYILGFFGVIVLLVIVVSFGGCVSYNGLVSRSQAVDQQWAQVQNVYQRRADLVPNLVATVQGSANFEKSTLTDVIQARAAATSVNVNTNAAPNDPNQLEQFDKAQGELSRSLGRLLVTVEAYPDLKSSKNFLTLQAQLEGTENRISTERGRFNDVTKDYNTKVQSFPSMIVARMGGFTPKPYFTATPAAQTVPPVNFNFDGGSPTTAH